MRKMICFVFLQFLWLLITSISIFCYLQLFHKIKLVYFHMPTHSNILYIFKSKLNHQELFGKFININELFYRWLTVSFGLLHLQHGIKGLGIFVSHTRFVNYLGLSLVSSMIICGCHLFWLFNFISN